MKYKVWTCRIVVPDVDLPPGFDSPPRMAAEEAIASAGIPVLMNSSGWGGALTDSDHEYLKNAGRNGRDDVYFAGVMDAPEDIAH